jgi:uncharacterized membrane protein
MEITYKQALQVYTVFGEMVLAYGLTPTCATPHFLRLDIKPMTLKQAAESVLKLKLPDMELLDAIKLAKVTPFSVEDWYRGCSDND